MRWFGDDIEATLFDINAAYMMVNIIFSMEMMLIGRGADSGGATRALN